jgi:hypothetical protein
MERRTLLKSLLVAPALALPIAPIVPTADLFCESLDTFNTRYGGRNRSDRVGLYSVFFTGLKTSWDSTILAGQWVAWPGLWLPEDQRRRIGKCFVSAVPGIYAKEYHPGEIFPIGPMAPRRECLTYEQFCSEDGQREIRAILADCRQHLVNLLKQDG